MTRTKPPDGPVDTPTLEDTIAGQLRTIWIAVGVITVALLLAVALVALGFVQLKNIEHSTAQQNVDARYDDCQSLNRLLAGMTSEVQQSEKTLPLEYKLVPQLNTPQVRALVNASVQRELKAFAPRPCVRYALAAVPPGQAGQYRTP